MPQQRIRMRPPDNPLILSGTIISISDCLRGFAVEFDPPASPRVVFNVVSTTQAHEFKETPNGLVATGLLWDVLPPENQLIRANKRTSARGV